MENKLKDIILLLMEASNELLWAYEVKNPSQYEFLKGKFYRLKEAMDSAERMIESNELPF